MGLAGASDQNCVVYLLGPLSVRDQSDHEIGSIPAGRAALLLQRVVAASGNNVEIDAIVDALWPDGAPASAQRTVASLVSRLRLALGTDVIVGSASSGYRFPVNNSWVSDLVLIERLVGEAKRRISPAPALAASAARRGLAMLDRGNVLGGGPTPDADWAHDLVRHVEGLRRRLRQVLWSADSQLGRWVELIDLAEAALEVEPHDEDAVRALMVGHWNNGDRGSALRAYDQLRTNLRLALGVEPSTETEELYSSIVGDRRSLSATAYSGAALPDDIRQAGRDVELGQLIEAWNSTAAGNVMSVVVSGPQGSGRTRLCTELAEIVERTGGRVLRAESAEGERSLFMHPILVMVARALLSTAPDDVGHLLGPYLGTAAELVPELRTVLTIPPYQAGSSDLEHRRALQTIEHLVTRLAEQRPLLLILDDLHLAGSSTVEALQWLLHQLAAMPLLLLSTVQPDHRDAGIARLTDRSALVELGPLSEDRVGALTTAAGFGDDEAEFVWELTRGHLLFVTEVLDALRRDVPRAEIPSSLRSVVLAGVRRTGPEVQQALEYGAFIGMTFAIDTLAQVMQRSPSELVAPLEAAVAASLLEPRDEVFAFSNNVIQQVLYDSTIGPVRQERHRWMAQVLADQPERCAWHLQQAGLLDQAAQAWLDAARQAQKAFSNIDAERLFTEAITAATTNNNNNGDPNNSETISGETKSGDSKTSVAVHGAALMGRGTVLSELGQYGQASADHEAAERLGLSVGDRRLQAQAVERQGWTAYYERDVAVAVSRAEAATRMPGAHPSAWVLLGRIRHWGGDVGRAAEAYNHALSELGKAQPSDSGGESVQAVRASALSCLGALLAHGDRYPEAIDVLGESVALCNEIGAFRPLLRSLFFEGLARANNGDLAAALTALETKKTLLLRYDVGFYRARTNTCLAWIWRELGDFSQAEILSKQALAESLEVEDGELQVEQELHALCSLADCSIIAGRHDEAAEYLTWAQDRLNGWLPFRWRAELRVLELSSRLGVSSAEQLLEHARRAGSAKYEALALHLLDCSDEAGRIATTTGSALLMAEVAPPEAAAAAHNDVLTRLPRQLRKGFVADGRLARQRQLFSD